MGGNIDHSMQVMHGGRRGDSEGEWIGGSNYVYLLKGDSNVYVGSRDMNPKPKKRSEE